MTNERHQPGIASEFELEDFRPATIYAFLVGLGVACIAVAVAVWAAYKIGDSYIRAHQPKNPMVEMQADTRRKPPLKSSNLLIRGWRSTSEPRSINSACRKNSACTAMAGSTNLPVWRAFRLTGQCN